MARGTATRIGALVVVFAACAAAWAVLAPTELGGSTRYVVTRGSSMEPALRAGDLALVRAQDDAGAGDVVLYEHPRLGAHVLHRIVRVERGRYVLKGDNNDFLDDVRPTADEIDGKLWIALPRLGSALMWAREPLHAALGVFVLAFFALGGGAAVSTARRAFRPRRPAEVRPNERGDTGRRGDSAQVVLAIGLAGVALFALLAVISRSRPATHTRSVPDGYAHVGSFSYGAEVEPSDVYPDGRVDTGEAVFLSLVPTLDVEFSYRLEADDPRAVRGTTQLGAVLSDGAGWTREIPLAEPTAFVGTTARAAGQLDIGSLTAIVDEMKALTGSGTTTFALGVTANVSVRGEVGGEPVGGRPFTPELPLLLDTVSLRPDAAGGASTTVRKAEVITVEVPASLAIGPLRLSVHDARTLSVLGLVLAALVVAIGGGVFWRTRTGGEPSQIASLFGDRLITISRPPSAEPTRVTDLRDAESLYRLAEHHDRIVLHWREGRDHVYEVDDGGSVYRYRTALGVEPGLATPDGDADTAIMPPTKLPSRAAASR